MDYKKLFDDKEFNKIIELTKDAKTSSELFIRLSAFIQLNQYDDALSIIESNQSLLEKELPFKTMKIHIELLLAKRDFKKARFVSEHYQTLPYISQEVEEYLADLPNMINEVEHFGDKEIHYSYEDIDKILTTSVDMSEISALLFSLNDYNLNKIIPALDIFLVRKDVHPNLRTYALILCVENRIDYDFVFASRSTNMNVNPIKLIPPYYGPSFEAIFNKIKRYTAKDPSLGELAIKLFNNYILDTYPNDIYSDVDEDEFVQAILSITRDYMSIHDDLLMSDTLLELKNTIKTILESTPELKL